MRAAVTIADNVRYVESFGAGWIPAVLMRKVDLSFLETNRRKVAGPKHLIASGSIMPTPAAPETISFFALHFRPGEVPLGLAPTSYLGRLCEGSRYEKPVRKILSRARLSAGDHGWRTELRDGEPSIAGSTDASVNALGALAHELGHCLFETLFGGPNDARLEIASETSAMAMEEWVMEQALPEPTRAAWRAHQRRLDDVNEAFHHLETGAPTARIMEPHLLPLRTTFFTAYGYQAVYHRASNLRRQILAASPRSLDELVDAFNSIVDAFDGAV